MPDARPAPQRPRPAAPTQATPQAPASSPVAAPAAAPPQSPPLAEGGAGAQPRPPYDFRTILLKMVERNASDLHLKVGRPPTLRVVGDLTPLDLPPLRPEDVRSIAEQTMNAKNMREFTDNKECDYALGLPGVGRFRVNAYQQRGTVAYAFRVVPIQARSVGELHLPPVVEKIAMEPRGLVLVTGVTGSGKSTALASIIDFINRNRHANIITIEDPIEFLHRDVNSHINQREVGTDTATFAQALRRVLRQDPDVILLGEIRDLETLDTAMQAADTGHLVFSTLHTTDATQTINRILSFYPPHQQAEVRFTLANALRAVISLRLVPRADRTGRVPAVEVLINTPAVRDNIRDTNKSLNIPELIREGTVQYGMQSFDQSLMAWYTSGVISYEDALFYASSASEFALRVQGVAGTSDTSWDSFQKGSSS